MSNTLHGQKCHKLSEKCQGISHCLKSGHSDYYVLKWDIRLLNRFGCMHLIMSADLLHAITT